MKYHKITVGETVLSGDIDVCESDYCDLLYLYCKTFAIICDSRINKIEFEKTHHYPIHESVRDWSTVRKASTQ